MIDKKAKRLTCMMLAMCAFTASAQNDIVEVFVRAMRNEAYTKVKGVDFGDKAPSAMTVRMGTTHNDGVTLEVRADGVQGELLASFKVSRTGGDDRWALAPSKVAAISGVHDLCFVCKGDKPGCVMYLDYWMFHQDK